MKEQAELICLPAWQEVRSERVFVERFARPGRLVTMKRMSLPCSLASTRATILRGLLQLAAA